MSDNQCICLTSIVKGEPDRIDLTSSPDIATKMEIIFKILIIRALTLLFILFFTINFTVAQVRVFKGISKYHSDVICNLNGSRVFHKSSSYYSDVIYSIRENKVYEKHYAYLSEVVFTVNDGKVFKGNSSHQSDILMTIKDGKIYKGNSTYNSDILANIKDGRVFNGNSGYLSDVIFTLDGKVSTIEFVAIWHVVKNNN